MVRDPHSCDAKVLKRTPIFFLDRFAVWVDSGLVLVIGARSGLCYLGKRGLPSTLDSWKTVETAIIGQRQSETSDGQIT